MGKPALPIDKRWPDCTPVITVAGLGPVGGPPIPGSQGFVPVDAMATAARREPSGVMVYR